MQERRRVRRRPGRREAAQPFLPLGLDRRLPQVNVQKRRDASPIKKMRLHLDNVLPCRRRALLRAALPCQRVPSGSLPDRTQRGGVLHQVGRAFWRDLVDST